MNSGPRRTANCIRVLLTKAAITFKYTCREQPKLNTTIISGDKGKRKLVLFKIILFFKCLPMPEITPNRSLGRLLSNVFPDFCGVTS